MNVTSWTKNSPFSLDQIEAYRLWRERKLQDYPRSAADLVVEINDPRTLRDDEFIALQRVLRKANMVIYRSSLAGLEDKTIVHQLAQKFGLARADSNILADEDRISALEVTAAKSGRGYIPYSNKRLLWHTDGYYNPPERWIRAFLLHCVRPAAHGGDNELLDPEIAYIRVRDQNPEFIRALMHPQAMTIPANTEDESVARAAQTGPVFSLDKRHGSLHLRYTARTRSIEWRDDDTTRAAVECLRQVLEAEPAFRFRYRLAAGEGLLCNNVLHNRTAFEDDLDTGRRRLLYRARYYDRLAGTELTEVYGQE